MMIVDYFNLHFCQWCLIYVCVYASEFGGGETFMEHFHGHARMSSFVHVIYYIIFRYSVTCDTCALMETVICAMKMHLTVEQQKKKLIKREKYPCFPMT